MIKRRPLNRENLIIATKVYQPMSDDVNECGSSRRHILLAVEQSLKRLKTNWLDILYLHNWDDEAAVEQSLAAVTTLVEQGKVMYCGISNFSAWQAMKTVDAAETEGLAPVVCIQPMYNLVKRQAEVEILPMALSEGLAVFPYNPLAAGLLSGKYHRNESGRLRESEMYRKRYENSQYWDIAARFVQYAASAGLSPAALAIAWVAGHPAVTAPILGARNLGQLNDTLQCLDIKLTVEERERISALSIAPPLATDR